MKKIYIALLAVPLIMGACSNSGFSSPKVSQDNKNNISKISGEAKKGSKISYSVNGDKFKDDYSDEYGRIHKIKVDKDNKFKFEVNDGPKKDKMKIKISKDGKTKDSEVELKASKSIGRYSKVAKRSDTYAHQLRLAGGGFMYGGEIGWPKEAKDFSKKREGTIFNIETDHGDVVSMSGQMKYDSKNPGNGITRRSTTQEFIYTMMASVGATGMPSDDVADLMEDKFASQIDKNANINETKDGINIKFKTCVSSKKLIMSYKITRVR